MANGVWHTELRRVLELDKEDLGLGTTPGVNLSELMRELLLPVGERDRRLLVCVESGQKRICKAEQHGVQSPYMYVRKHRGPDGALRLRAAHLPTVHEMTAEEGDAHKAMKEFIARTAEAAGLPNYIEKSTKTRTSRPDVTIIGDGGLSLGCEAQYYNASAGTVLRRSKNHADAGLTANWITHDDSFHLIDRANWMLTNRVTWRQIENAADLPLAGGFRVLAEWRCTADAQRPCPDGKVKTGCGKVHLQWDTPRRLDSEASGWTSYEGDRLGVTVGRTLVGAATGAVASVFVPSRKDMRAGSHLWVPASDKEKWVDYRGEIDLPLGDESDPDDELHFSGRDADTTCRFGEDTWKPSAPLKRRGITAVGLAMTVDWSAPAPATGDTECAASTTRPWIDPPPVPKVTPHRCSSGVTPCGAPARFYACGWRCDEHSPAAMRAKGGGRR